MFKNTNFNSNAFRLFLKIVVTAWVPILVLGEIVPWDEKLSVAIMAASCLSIDGFFAMFGVGESQLQKSLSTVRRRRSGGGS